MSQGGPMAEHNDGRERLAWAGPALFIVVAALLFAFFWWFVQA
jgi:hypothetical protein